MRRVWLGHMCLQLNSGIGLTSAGTDTNSFVVNYSSVVRTTAYVGLEYIYNCAVASGTLEVVPLRKSVLGL